MKTLIPLLVLALLSFASNPRAGDDLLVIRITAKTLPLYADAAGSSEVVRFTRDQISVPAGGLAVQDFDKARMMLKITVNGETGWVEAHRVETNRPPSLMGDVCDRSSLPPSSSSARNAGERGTCSKRR